MWIKVWKIKSGNFFVICLQIFFFCSIFFSSPSATHVCQPPDIISKVTKALLIPCFSNEMVSDFQVNHPLLYSFWATFNFIQGNFHFISGTRIFIWQIFNYFHFSVEIACLLILSIFSLKSLIIFIIVTLKYVIAHSNFRFSLIIVPVLTLHMSTNLQSCMGQCYEPLWGV